MKDGHYIVNFPIMEYLAPLPDNYENAATYETHSAVKRPNAVLCKRMRSPTDRSKLPVAACRSTRERRRPHYFDSEHYRVRVREIEKV